MMKPRVYIETTIASAYHETRQSPDVVARRDWTREWWDEHRSEYELLTSQAVLHELQRGTYPHQAEAVAMLKDIPILDIGTDVRDAAVAYLTNFVMPSDPGGDALHLALASVHRCDYLLTWNCRHLANAKKTVHIRRINEQLGLFVPVLTTPLELLEEDLS